MVSGIGIAAYSVYSGQSSSIYGSSPISGVKNNEDSQDTQHSQAQGDIEDTATISDQAQKLYASEKNNQTDQLPAEKKTDSKDSKDATTDQLPAEKKTNAKDETDKTSGKTGQKTSGQLTQKQQQEVQKLKERDAEVRAHEQAHISAAAGLRTSSPSFTYETGPDGKKYAVGGEVNVSFSESGNPEDDLKNAETMKRAALAPADPSSQDKSVAREADQLIQKAEQEITQQKEQQKTEIVASDTAKTLVGAAG